MATFEHEPPIDPADVLLLDDDRFDPAVVCIVTGAASGIGRATALAGAANGLTVCATDVDAGGLDGTVALAAEHDAPGTIEPVVADLADDDGLDQIVAVANDLGDIRFLANIAGMQHVAPLAEFPMDVYDTMQAVMVRAPVYLSRASLPYIAEAGGGAIGNMCSVHGHIVTTDKVAYNVAKFAVRGLTQSIAAEGEGVVRGFSVSTGYVATPLVTGQLADTAERRGLDVEEVVEQVMLGNAPATELMRPVDVANLFVFGFSTYARHLNGGDLLFDGGMVRTYA